MDLPRLGTLDTDLQAYILPSTRLTARRTTPKLPAPITLPTSNLHTTQGTRYCKR